MNADLLSQTHSSMGIALGGGAARGLCHIGVLKVFSLRGIHFPIVTGTSMGAIVGAAYVCGKLEEAEVIARSVTARTMSGWADVNLRSGALKGDVVKSVFQRFIGDITFADLRSRGIEFMVVAADLDKEEPVYINEGRVDDAVRASMSVPGVFEPISVEGRVLVDGGLIDNVPVEAARALGASKVVGVEVYNPHDIWTRTALGVGLSVVQAREMKARLQELAKEQHVPWQRSLAAYKGLSGRLSKEHFEERSGATTGVERRRLREFITRLHLGAMGKSDSEEANAPVQHLEKWAIHHLGAANIQDGEGWTAFRATLGALDILTSLLEKGRAPFRANSQADLFIRPDVRRFHAHQFYRAAQLITEGELAAIAALPEVMAMVAGNGAEVCR